DVGEAAGRDLFDAARRAEARGDADDDVVGGRDDFVGAACPRVGGGIGGGGLGHLRGVAAFTALESVVARAADGDVVAARAGDGVVAGATVDLRDAGQGGGREVERVVAAAADDRDVREATRGDFFDAARGAEARGDADGDAVGGGDDLVGAAGARVGE